MKPSGLNSIEFILSILVGLWKIAGWIVLIIVVGPVLYLLWSWNTMSYQAKTIQALNAAPATQVILDLNRCQADQGFLLQVPGVAPKDTFAWAAHWLPWAPGMPPDQNEPYPTTSLGNYEPLYLDTYRHRDDVPHGDPWYLHGLLKLAPTRYWYDGTGPDYAFGKVAGNYQAYVGAVRAVMSMRYLLGGLAAGMQPEELTEAARRGNDAQLVDPASAAKVAGTGKAAFLRGYATDFGGKLPVVSLDLQKFEDRVWNYQEDLHAMDKGLDVTWDKRMGWWGGTGAGNGVNADNSRDFYITGLRLQGQSEGRPHFTPLDFLVYHLPSTTFNQDRARGELARMTEDAFWLPLLPDTPQVRDAVNILLYHVRQDLDHDYRFSRKYGYILFQGDKFGRDSSIMKE
jgi:hypothetical protein